SHLVAVVGGFEDEDGIGFGVGLQTGEVDEGRMRTETVVGVVRADLEAAGGNDEPFAGEGSGDLSPTCGCEAGCGEGLGVERGASPAGGDEIAEGSRVGAVRAVVDAVCECLSRVWSLCVLLCHVPSLGGQTDSAPGCGRRDDRC